MWGKDGRLTSVTSLSFSLDSLQLAATWQYTPPELIGTKDPSRPKGATEQVDVWAMGCVFLEILRCATPFVVTYTHIYAHTLIHTHAHTDTH